MPRPRSVQLERLAYTVAAPVLAAAPHLPHGMPIEGVIDAGGIAGVVASIVAFRDHSGAGRKVMRWSPLTTALAVEYAAHHTGTTGDVIVATVWWAAGFILHPLSGTTRRRGRPAPAYVPPPQIAPAPVPALPQRVDRSADPLTAKARNKWEMAGNPGSTIIVKVIPHPGMKRDMTLVLRAEEELRPITGLSQAAVAAVFGLPEEVVSFSAVIPQPGVPGGPSWLEARLTPDAFARRRKDPTPKERWHDKVGHAKGGAPGSEFVDKQRDDERGVTFYRAKMTDPTEVPRVDLAKVCRGLDIKYDDSCVFLVTEDHEFLISVFDEPPLSKVFPATRALLTPNAKGMFVQGVTVTGQPVMGMVYQHDKNAACHGLILGVSRSGKTQYFAIKMAAESLEPVNGAVIWLSTVRRDEKTSVLGRYIDRQGSNPLFMVRQLRAMKALCVIRASMPWPHDGQPHDYKPGDPRCPYRPLNGYLDEFMTGAQDGRYGAEIQELAEDLGVTGLKYGIGLDVAGQSPFAHNGFSTELKDNLRQNSRPIIFNMGSPAATRKAAEGTMENTWDLPAIPARYSRQEGSIIERAMAGEGEPENGVSTGGVAITVLDNGRPILMRALFVDFDDGLDEIFPGEVKRLTRHEIDELERLGLWGDWNRPDEDLEAEDDLDDDGERPAKGRSRKADSAVSRRQVDSTPVQTPEEALARLDQLLRK